MPVDEEGERFAAIRRAKERHDTDYLIGALVDPVHRVWAAVYLGQLEVAEAAEPLLRLLDVADPTVRYHAAQSLGWIGALQAHSRLRETATEDEDDGVRAGAVWALGDIGDRSDLEPDSDGVPCATGIALLGLYFVLRYFVGFWWAIVLTVGAALVLAVFRLVGAITREETSPPPRQHRRRE